MSEKNFVGENFRHLAKILSLFYLSQYSSGFFKYNLLINLNCLLLYNSFCYYSSWWIQKVHNIRFTTSQHKNTGCTSAKTPTASTNMYLFVTFIFTVSGCNIIRARKLDVQKKAKKNIKIWFEILVEWNQFLVRLKFLLPILLFVTFSTTSPTFPETHIFACTRNGVVPYTVKNPQSQPNTALKNLSILSLCRQLSLCYWIFLKNCFVLQSCDRFVSVKVC